MLNEHQIQMLPERIYQRLNAINTDYLISIGEVLKEIGELRPTDVNQLQRMYDYGAQSYKLSLKLAETSDKDINEIYDIFDVVAKQNYSFAQPFYVARSLDYIPYEENIHLQRTVKAMAKQTVDEYVNLTQHTAFAVFDKDGKSIAPYFAANKDKIATSLSETYTKVVDYAVTQVNLGMESYSKAVKDIIKSMSASGIRTVDYATGYSRRLDTAVRQNVLWGAKECNQQIANQVGEEFGSDGREVDYHMYPRPSHADMGGRQFALGKARTVNGVFYPSFEEKAAPFLEEFGCLHFSFPIILGVSQPAYSEDELEDFKRADNATFEFEGKKYTMYQGTQLQRQVETAIRNQRDILTMAKAAGDGETELIARTKIRQLTNKYAELSEVSGLPTQMERTKLAVSAKTVDKSRGSGIMKAEPASIYVNTSEALYSNAKDIKPIKNFEDIVIHSDGFNFELRSLDSKTSEEYSVREFAEILKKDPNYHGGNIRLIACQAGADGATAAQILANQLGVEVMAPTDVVWVFPGGKMVIGPDEFTDIGEWKIFKPKEVLK